VRSASRRARRRGTDFHALEPHEVEDVLFIFKDTFALSLRTRAHPIATREAARILQTGLRSPLSHQMIILIQFLVSLDLFSDVLYGINYE
jgi:Mg2+ and Co2+ transporter CorA